MKRIFFTFLTIALAIIGLQAQDLQIHKTDGTIITVPLNAIDSITFYESGLTTPIAAFTAAPTSGTAPLAVNFTDQSSNNPTTWQWNFGDGGTSSQQNPTHTYQNAGSYSVQLTVTNSAGSDTETKTNYIIVTSGGGVAPVAAFTATPTSGAAPLTVNFTDQSSYNPTSWQWNFGDGGTSTLQNPARTYQNAGNYTVQLTVANSYGSDTVIKPNYIFVSEIGEPCPGMPTVTDIDGNVYNTILIGTQCWMKDNLKTTMFKNGTSIPNVTNDSVWSNLTTGAYAWHGNDTSWKDKYGALYNWYAVSDPNGLCPSGWHVPTDIEWIALTDHIGGTVSPNGNKLKSCRQVNSPLGGDCNTTIHPRWEQHNTHYGTDDYSFSGLPGGFRGFDGYFYGIGNGGYWWSSTESLLGDAWSRTMVYTKGWVNETTNYKVMGFSVRCLRDD